MVATVLIGRESGGAGVTTRLFHLGDENDADFARSTNSAKVRHEISEAWAILRSSVIPALEQEMVFKCFRQAVVDGQAWTGIGCYRWAKFHDVREGTYLGCGMIGLNQTFDASASVRYISQLLQQFTDLVAEDGKVFKSVHNVKGQAVGIKGRSLDDVAAPIGEAGLSATGAHRLYIDLSSVGEKAEFDRRLSELLDSAQKDPAFQAFNELIVGNTPRLRKSADDSRAYKVYQPSEWAAAVAHHSASGTRIEAAAAGGAETQVRRSADSTRTGPSPDRADLIKVIRGDLQRVETAIETVNQKIGNLARPAEPRGLVLPPLAVYLLGAALTMITFFLAWIAFNPGEGGDRAGTSQDGQIMTDDASSTGDALPGCTANIRPDEPIDAPSRKMLEKEIRCLQQETGARNERVREIESWLDPANVTGAGAVTAPATPPPSARRQ